MTPDFTFSFVGAAHETTTQPATFRALLHDIKSGKWEQKVYEVRWAFGEGGKDEAAAPKRALPGALFSGTFSRRAAAALTKHSGLICADLDDLNSTLSGVRELIESDPHTLACFLSPSGNGLKVIFRCDPTKPHIDSFHAAEQHILTQFGLHIDQACKDVSRLCFVSHDPEAFVADDATILPYPTPKAKDFHPKDLGLDTRPGDDYDRRASLPDLLQKHGWSQAQGKNWTRPGKDSGISASLDHVPGRFHCFTSSTQFEANHTYKPWHVYAILEHGGDFSAAAKALAQQGFGTPAKKPGERFLEDRSETKPPVISPQRTPFSFSVPAANDSSVLLGNRYLNKGDGLILSGPSGMGKSSMQMQMSACWALGRSFHGIPSNGPLRSLIIQSEDSDGDIAEVWASIQHAMALKPSEQAQIDQNIRIVSDRVNRGEKFLSALRQHIAEFKPDLLWINPLQAFMDGDVTDSQDLGEFLREGLNGLNDGTFGYCLVHHTTKPATGKDKAERQWHEVMYDMAGGAELINWARAIISIRPLENQGEFKLVLAKRGRRAGVTREVQQGVGTRHEAVTVLGLKHSQDHLPSGQAVIFWEACVLPTPEEQVKAKKGGRPVLHEFSEYRSVFPKKNTEGATINELARLLIQNGPVGKNNVHPLCKRWASEGHVQIIDADDGPRRYRATL